MINILLVDDHIAVAEGTKALLEQDNRFQVSVCSEISVLDKILANEREQQILQAIANGLTNKEISQALQYSQRTVEYSLTHIFEKLHVKSRTEALRKARKYHLIFLVDIY